jgi:hypothetical protein
MTKLHKDDQAQPCFITDGPPSNDLPIPPHRTMNLPQILAGLTDDELATWPSVLSKREVERRLAGQHRPV